MASARSRRPDSRRLTTRDSSATTITNATISHNTAASSTASSPAMDADTMTDYSPDGEAAMPSTGWFRRAAPMEPQKRAAPKAKMPPSAATTQ